MRKVTKQQLKAVVDAVSLVLRDWAERNRSYLLKPESFNAMEKAAWYATVDQTWAADYVATLIQCHLGAYAEQLGIPE